MSLYEVSEVVSGQSMTLRDLLRDVAPVTVREHGATQTLVNWDKIAARIVDVNGRHGISGALLPFSADGAVRVIDAFFRLVDDAQGTVGLDHLDKDALLRASGPMFTHMWLLDCLGKAIPDSSQDMVNADGDDLVFHPIVFPLAKGVMGKSAVRRLNAAQWLEPASDTFWNWLAPVATKRTLGTTKGRQAFVTPWTTAPPFLPMSSWLDAN